MKEEIFNQLNKYRLKNESFSEVMKRLLESNADILDLAGAWKKISDVESALDVVEKIVKKILDEENDVKLI